VTFVWFALGVLLFTIVMLTLVDIVRRGGSFWSSIGWSALVIFLPFFGSIAYWVLRRPSAAEVEQARLAQEDDRRTAAQRPIGR
jgi:hypothetical protein